MAKSKESEHNRVVIWKYNNTDHAHKYRLYFVKEFDIYVSIVSLYCRKDEKKISGIGVYFVMFGVMSTEQVMIGVW